MNLLQKVESEMGFPDWQTAMHSLRLQRLLWIYCPCHAGISGNERADRLANTANITTGLQLGRAEVLRGLRNFQNMDIPEHHSIGYQKEKEWRKEAVNIAPSEVGRKRSVFNQTNIGTVFEVNFRKTSERRSRARMGISERYYAFFSRN